MRWSSLQWLHILMYVAIVVETESIYVNITYVRNAVAKGAGGDFFEQSFFVFLNDFGKSLHFCTMMCISVCLDGSPPAYHFDRGYGTGNSSWLIQLEVNLVLPRFRVFIC